MAQKKTKDKPGEAQAVSIMDSARQIWLAGLGAFSKAEEEGSKLFESLVKEGEKVEARTRKAAEDKVEEVKGKVEEVKDKVEEVKDKATDTWDGLEQVFEERVSRALMRLGVPTNDDVHELSRRVEELTEYVKNLGKKR